MGEGVRAGECGAEVRRGTGARRKGSERERNEREMEWQRGRNQREEGGRGHVGREVLQEEPTALEGREEGEEEVQGAVALHTKLLHRLHPHPPLVLTQPRPQPWHRLGVKARGSGGGKRRV